MSVDFRKHLKGMEKHRLLVFSCLNPKLLKRALTQYVFNKKTCYVQKLFNTLEF